MLFAPLRSKMKALVSISILLWLSSIASAAICFSAEEVGATAVDGAAAATTAADSGGGLAGVAPTSASAATAGSSNVVYTAPALVLASQSTGTAGSAGTFNGIGGGGGSAGIGDDVESPATSDEVTEAAQNGPASDDAGAVSMPEPSTSIVWILLAACGFGFVRFRNRK